MDENVSSAEPAALYRYADRSGEVSARLRDAARRLAAVLADFTARCAGAPGSVTPELADRLRRHLDDVEAWDAWVRQVGRAFEEAGDGELVLPPSFAGGATPLVGRFPGQVGTGEAAVLTTRGGIGATTGTATTDSSASSGLVGTPGAGSGRVAIDASAPTTVPPPDEEPDLAVDDDFLAPLDGFWSQSDAAGELDLRGDGDEVRALRGEGWVCLPGGPAPVSGAPSDAGTPVSNRLFTATRQGSDLVGEVEVCWHDGHARHEWAPAPLHLTLTPDGEQLTGTWQDRARGTAVAITLSRADVEPLAPEDLGLPPTNLAIRGYGILAARRADGTTANVSDDYILDPDADEAVVRHRGVDFTSRDAGWVVAPLPFAAPVGGTVHVYADSSWNTIGLRLDTGDWLQFLHAGEVFVQTGQRVEAGTTLGRTGATGATAIHLHLQARSPTGAFLDPRRVVARARRAAHSDPA